MEDFVSKIIGNGMVIVMLVAVFFGTSKQLGYVAAGSSVAIILWVVYLYLKHPELFKKQQ
jgi:hypothetical protein